MLKNEGKIIHFALDEKFINSAYNQFEKVAPGKNEFYIVVAKLEKTLDHVCKVERVHLLLNTTSAKLDLIKNITKDDLVIFHSLTNRFYEIVLSLEGNITTVWFCFGYEVYNDLHFISQKKLLAPITIRHFFQVNKNAKYKLIKEYARPYYRRIKSKLPLSSFEIKKNAINRIDYLGSSFPEEFRAICQLIKMKKKFFSFWYYPLSQIVNTDKVENIKKTTIWIGNSGFVTGNHLDVFQLLKKMDISNFDKIIVPLSYGNKEYIEEIVRIGNFYFKTSFEPLTDFLALTEYNKKLQTAGIAILYNKRQQALGNIIALLWFGSKVFLSSSNPIYSFLIRKGFFIFNMEEDFKKIDALYLLTQEQKKLNRDLLYHNFGDSHLQEELQLQLQKI